MKNVKVTNTMLMVNFEFPITVGAVSLNAIGQAHISKGDDCIDVDVDFIDHDNITYMNMKVDGYKGYAKLREMHTEMGIDLNKLLNEEFDRIVKGQDVVVNLIKQFESTPFV